jgi:predicted metal-dependent hydrolase
MEAVAAVAEFKIEVRRWGAKLRVRPRRIEVRQMARKWASCSPAGRVCFSRDLIFAEQKFRTYVIVHELLHLRYPNHGKVFRRLLRAFGGADCNGD